MGQELHPFLLTNGIFGDIHTNWLAVLSHEGAPNKDSLPN
jgi:hypothetical protein